MEKKTCKIAAEFEEHNYVQVIVRRTCIVKTFYLADVVADEQLS
ncbi:hypothetical protein Hanom_Chr02g00120651 [Helianthus anomalus]